MSLGKLEDDSCITEEELQKRKQEILCSQLWLDFLVKGLLRDVLVNSSNYSEEEAAKWDSHYQKLS